MKRFASIALITGLALALRCWTADWGSFSADEANGIAIAVTGSWADMVKHLKEDGNPPLFYAIVRIYAAIFGGDDLVLRLLTVTLSALLVPLTYLFARWFVEDRVAFQAALLTALCPPLIRFGTMMRMYSLLPMFSLTSVSTGLRLLQSPGSWLWRAAFASSTAGMIYCHHWGFLVALGLTALVAFGLARRWWDWRCALTFAFCLACAGISYLPWVPVLYYTLTHDESPWAVAPAITHLVVETPPEALIGRLTWRDPWGELGIMYAGFWVGFALLFAGAGQGEVAGHKAPAPAAGGVPLNGPDAAPPAAPVAQTIGRTAGSGAANCLRWVVVFGLVGALALSSVKPAWRDRYLVAFTPLILILIVSSLEPFRRKLGGLKAACLPSLIWLPVWIPQYAWLDELPESSAWAIADKVRRECDPKKDLVVVSWEAVSPAISRVLPEDVPMMSFPNLGRVYIIKWDGMNARLRDEERMDRLKARMRQVLDGGGSIWLVDSLYPATSLAVQPTGDALKRLHFLEVEQLRRDQVRTWLKVNASQEGAFILAPGRDISMLLSVYKPAAVTAGGRHRESISPVMPAVTPKAAAETGLAEIRERAMARP